MKKEMNWIIISLGEGFYEVLPAKYKIDISLV